jgi:hypothetical protein
MKTIYESSAGTFIWLGPDSDDSEMAMRMIEHYDEAWRSRPPELKHAIVKDENKSEYLKIAEKELHPDYKQAVEAVTRLFLRAWWRRAWIVQETVVSPGAVLFCGTAPITWEWVTSTIRVLMQHLVSYRTLSGDNGNLMEALIAIALRAMVGYRCIESFRAEVVHLDPPAVEFPEALHRLRPSHASDPRDKVYAALGLTKNANFISVDYNQSVCDVYTSATRRWIETSNDLHILGFCGIQLTEGLPTWVTDWAKNDSFERDPLYKRISIGKDDAESQQEKVYSAGGKHTLKVKFGPSSRILILQGIPLDKLDFVGQPSGPFTTQLSGTLESKTTENLYQSQLLDEKAISDFVTDKIFYGWLRLWLEKQKDAGEYCRCLYVNNSNMSLDEALSDELGPGYTPTNESILDAYHRTLMTDIYFDESSVFSGRIQEGRDDFVGNSMLFSVFKMFIGRVFMATTLGFMVLGPEEGKLGDFIYIIPGSETLFLLRPKGDGDFTFVGECYVHGMMDGQLFEDGEIETEELRIF